MGATESKQNKPQGQAEENEDQELKWNKNWQINWTKEEEKSLRESILEGQKDSLGNPVKVKILLFGLTGHGKSTLGNGFRSALLDYRRVSHYHQTGATGTSGTFTRGIWGALYNEHLCILDMSGLYESKSFKDENVKAILKGEVAFNVKFTEHLEVIEQTNMAIPEPGTNDVSCVVIVSKPDTEFGEETRRLVNIVDSLARDGVISRHLVLTHLDKADPLFVDPKNLPTFTESQKVQASVKKMSNRTGIPPSAISFVRNYVRESMTDKHSNILLLTVLDQILHDAKECHERKVTVERMKPL